MSTIYFISEFEVTDPGQRSGVPFFIWTSIIRLYPDAIALQVKDGRTLGEKLMSRFWQALFNQVFNKKFGWPDAFYHRSYARGFARSVKHITFKSNDSILTINPRTVAYLRGNPRILIWIDNTFYTNTFYPGRENISQFTHRQANEVEQIAFKRAINIFAASSWLKQIIISSNPILAGKTHVMPRGANVLHWPGDELVFSIIGHRMQDSPLKILFVNSGNWEVGRKGGNLVIEIYTILKKLLDVRLTIVGHVPEKNKEEWAAMGIDCKGKLSPSDPVHRHLYENCLKEAHLMLVPSKADGFGIVYAEASVWGLPSFARAIMGVTEAVRNGINGFALPGTANASDFADQIHALWASKEGYKKLCYSARELANQSFCWTKNVGLILKNIESR